MAEYSALSSFLVHLGELRKSEAQGGLGVNLAALEMFVGLLVPVVKILGWKLHGR